jgi:hypothetical protein
MTHVSESDRARNPASPKATAVSSGYVYFDEKAASHRLGDVSARRLKDLRQSGGGPRYVRIGMAVRYRSDWLDAWAEENAVTSTSEETARRRPRGRPHQPAMGG